MDSSTARTTLPAPIGPVSVEATSRGVIRVAFGQLPDSPDRPHSEGPEAAAILDLAAHQLREYFAGTRQHFDLPIDWSLSSGWQLTVRRRLFDAVDFGTTISYGKLAALAGRPDGARAVGGIMAGNPIPVIVPCHRVISSDGGLGGFAGSGGAMVETKRKLLELEGSAAPTLF